jgi:hypothetical protein
MTRTSSTDNGRVHMPSKAAPYVSFVRLLSCLGSFALSYGAHVGAASAAPTCRTNSDACRATYLCFMDYETGCWGRLSGTNADWNEFGWGDRADWFENHGTRCSSRAFANTWYTFAIVELARGEYQNPDPYWDHAESNNWYGCM